MAAASGRTSWQRLLPLPLAMLASAALIIGVIDSTKAAAITPATGSAAEIGGSAPAIAERAERTTPAGASR